MKAIQFKNATYLKQFMLLTLLILITSISVSCSEDDTVKEEPKESIIGKWQVIEEAPQDEGEIELTECRKKSTIEFTSNGSYISFSYTDSEDNTCYLDEYQGKWIDIGNNSLELIDGDGDKNIMNYVFIDGNLKLIALDDKGNIIEYLVYKKI